MLYVLTFASNSIAMSSLYLVEGMATGAGGVALIGVRRVATMISSRRKKKKKKRKKKNSMDRFLALLHFT